MSRKSALAITGFHLFRPMMRLSPVSVPRQVHTAKRNGFIFFAGKE